MADLAGAQNANVNSRKCARCRYHMGIELMLKGHRSNCPFKTCLCKNCNKSKTSGSMKCGRRRRKRRSLKRKKGRRGRPKKTKATKKLEKSDKKIPKISCKKIGRYEERKPVEELQADDSERKWISSSDTAGMVNKNRYCLVLYPGQRVADALEQNCVPLPMAQLSHILKQEFPSTSKTAMLPYVHRFEGAVSMQEIQHKTGVCKTKIQDIPKQIILQRLSSSHHFETCIRAKELLQNSATIYTPENYKPPVQLLDIDLLNKMFPECTPFTIRSAMEKCNNSFCKTVLTIIKMKSEMAAYKEDFGPHDLDVLAYHLLHCFGCEKCLWWHNDMPWAHESGKNGKEVKEKLGVQVKSEPATSYINENCNLMSCSGAEHTTSTSVGEALRVLHDLYPI